MECPSCGLPLEPGVGSCGHCGTAIAGGSSGLSVIVRDVTGSQIAVGDGNVQIQLSVDGSAQFERVTGGITLEVREIPVLTPTTRPDLVGRDALVEQASDDLLRHRSVQLFGLPGVGRTAVADAVLRRLAPAGVRAVELRRRNRPNTLESLYQQLVQVFFGKIWYQPEEAVLRIEAAKADLRVLIVIIDCDLDHEDISRLLGSFPSCTFLLTSRLQTLNADAGTAYEVDPLTPGQARELITRTLGGDLAGLQDVQWEQAYRLAGGKVQRLMEHAAFLKRAATRPGLAGTQPVPLSEQIAVLVAGLTEPARRVLIALSTFSVALAPRLFGAVTGLPQAVGTAGELVAAGLVQEKGGAFVVTPDADEILARGAERTDAKTAADGLMPLLHAPDPPDPILLLAVARALHDTGQDAITARLIRAAAPLALAAGEIEAWIRLVALGAQASVSSRRKPDIEFFLNEQRASSLLQGDKVAVAAALAAVGTGISGQRGTAKRAAQARRAARQGQRLASHGGRTLFAGHAVGVVITGGVAIVAGGVISAVVVTSHSGSAALGLAGDWTTASGGVIHFAATGPNSYTASADATAGGSHCHFTDVADMTGSNGRYRGSLNLSYIASGSGCTEQSIERVPGTIDVAADGKTAQLAVDLGSSLSQFGVDCGTVNCTAALTRR